jgi:cAMP phosphodiesterase
MCQRENIAGESLWPSLSSGEKRKYNMAVMAASKWRKLSIGVISIKQYVKI